MNDKGELDIQQAAGNQAAIHHASMLESPSSSSSSASGGSLSIGRDGNVTGGSTAPGHYKPGADQTKQTLENLNIQ
jgi:hypothetical protein